MRDSGLSPKITVTQTKVNESEIHVEEGISSENKNRREITTFLQQVLVLVLVSGLVFLVLLGISIRVLVLEY